MSMGVNPLAFVVSLACILLTVTSRQWMPAEGNAYMWAGAALLLRRRVRLDVSPRYVQRRLVQLRRPPSEWRAVR